MKKNNNGEYCKEYVERITITWFINAVLVMLLVPFLIIVDNGDTVAPRRLSRGSFLCEEGDLSRAAVFSPANRAIRGSKGDGVLDTERGSVARAEMEDACRFRGEHDLDGRELEFAVVRQYVVRVEVTRRRLGTYEIIPGGS